MSLGFTPSSPDAYTPVSGDQNLSRRIQLINNVAPMLSQGDGQKFALQLAQSDMDDQTMTHTAQLSASQALVGGYKQHLEQIADPVAQYKEWSGFDAGQKRLLTQAGYVAPPKPQKQPDTTLLGMVREVGGAALHAAGTLVGAKYIGEGLNTIAAPLRQVQHLYRAASLGIQEEGILGLGGSISQEDKDARRNSLSGITSDFLNLWDRTKNGEKTFGVKALDRVHNSISDDDKFQFVEAMAGGTSAVDYVSSVLKVDPTDPNFDNLISKYSQYQAMPDVQGAIKDLRNNKISVGRDIARNMHMKPGGLAFNLVSGGLDATADVLGDPTLMLGKSAKIYSLTKYSITAAQLADTASLASRVDFLAQQPRFARAAEQIALRFREGNPAALLDELPQMRNGLNDFSNYLIENGIAKDTLSADDVFTYYKSQAGIMALDQGKFAMPHFPGTILPSLTKVEAAKASFNINMKGFVEGIRGFNFKLEDLGLDTLSPEQLKETFGLHARAALTTEQIQSSIGDFLHGFITKIPKGDFITPDLPGDIGGINAGKQPSINDFRAMLDYSLPNKLRDDYVNQWLAAENYGSRRAVYEAGVDAMFRFSGAYTTDAGRAYAERFLQYGKSFAADGKDLIDNVPAGIGEKDLAEGWAIPDFREMLKVTAQTTQLRRILDYTNEGMINRFMASYWKPSVLLKAGFIPRAYGEEYLGFILREGMKPYLHAQAAITATKEGDLAMLKPVRWIADSLLSHVSYIPGAQPTEIYARNFSIHTSNFIRDWAEKLAPDEYLNAARNLAERGGMDGAMNNIGTVYGEASTPVGQRLRAEMIGERQEDGSVKMINVHLGEYKLHGRSDAFYPQHVIREMRRMADDRLYAPLIDAGRRKITQERGREILDHFQDAGLVSHEPARAAAAQLYDLRMQVPDAAMPGFEKRLRNTSFASYDMVHNELVEAGMDPDMAREFINAIDYLDPRERVSIFTRDGQIERVHGIHKIDPDAPFNAEANVPYVRQQVEDQATREHRDLLMSLWGHGDSQAEMERMMLRRLNSADMQRTVEKSVRSRKTLDGRNVAEGPSRGSKRVYTLIMDQDPPPVTSAFEEVPAVSRINPYVDADEGWVPIQSQEINNLIPEYQPSPNIIDFKGEQLTHDEMAWFTQDFRHAQQMQSKLSYKFKGQNVSIGYTDIPEDVFHAGKNAATAQELAGVGPLAEMNKVNQVYIPKTWRQNYQVIGDDYQLIDENYKTWQQAKAELEETWKQTNPLAQKEADAQSIQAKINAIENQLAKPETGHPVLDNIEIKRYEKGIPKHDYVDREEARARVAELQEELAANGLTKEEAQQLAELRSQAMEQMAQSRTWHAAIGVDRQAALRDWSQVLRERYQQVFETQNPLSHQMHRLMEGRLSVKDLWELTGEELPEHVMGPTILKPERQGMLHSVTQRGFDAVGKGGNAMIRNAMFLHYYAQRLEATTTRAAAQLAEQGAMRGLTEAAEKLGTTPNKLRLALKSLPEDIRTAANPYEAALVRDPIPPALRTIDDPEDIAKFTEAWNALYEYQNPDLMKDAEAHWNNTYGARGTKPQTEYTFDDAQDSYLSLDKKMRDNITNTSELPEQIPAAMQNGHMLNTDEWTQLRDAIDNHAHIWKTAHEVAMNGAINDTIPWVDDHRVRSQFQQHGRNLIPFWFAQENFIRRTANNLLRDPAAIRKAELLLSGMHNAGFVAQNQFGEDVFNIPATGFLLKTLAQGANYFGNYSLPMVNPMTGQLKYSLPGLDSLDRIGPSFSPIAAIPMKAVARKFPELQEGVNALLGERGQGKSVVDMLIPSYASTFYKGLVHDPKADEEMIASAIHTAQMLEANGLGLPEDAEPYQHDDWMKRIENHTRLAFMLKGIVGFFSPASPSTNPPDEFTPEFHDIMRKAGSLEAAQDAFMAAHPDAKPYTIFTTQVKSGAPLPTSEEVGKFLDENEDFLHANPIAGPWLIPQNDSDKFSNTVYTKELARGLRERKSFKDWYDDYYFASAATDYFDTKEDYDLRMAAAKGNTPLRQQLTDGYQKWKDEYLDNHRIFARLLDDPTAGDRRQEILDGMDKALSDPNSPDVPHKQQLKDLTDTFKDYRTLLKSYNRQNTADNYARQAVKENFQVWLIKYVAENPSMQAFYDRVIRPEMQA